MREFLRATWVIFRKDLRVWLRRPTSIAVTFIPPLSFLLVQALGSAAVGRSPVALVNFDQGNQGALAAQAIQKADVFRLHEVGPTQAQALLMNLDVVAVITIPADFTQRYQARQSDPIDVTVNNLNLDFTNDIRRAVPDAITQFYKAQGTDSPIKIGLVETDLRQRDVELFQYAVLPTIVLLLTISGLVNGGLVTAGEWESRTIKELLVSPAPQGAIVAGKALVGAFTTFVLGTLVLAAGAGLGWTRPEGVSWLVALMIIGLIALFGSGLGVAIGAAFQKIRPVIAVSINSALYLFFLAGGISVLAFEPGWLQAIAAFIPLTYGNHALEMAIFYHSSDLLARDTTVLVLSAAATLLLGGLAVKRRIGD